MYMYTGIHLQMCVCVHTLVYIYIRTFMYSYIHTHTYTYTYTYTYIYIYIYVYVYISSSVCVCTPLSTRSRRMSSCLKMRVLNSSNLGFSFSRSFSNDCASLRSEHEVFWHKLHLHIHHM